MRTITYLGDTTVVIGNVATFQPGVPVEVDDDVELNLDPALWRVDPPFAAPVPAAPVETPTDTPDQETTNG